MNLQFFSIDPGDHTTADLIAGWYLTEWNIEKSRTVRNLTERPNDVVLFQILMTLDGRPVGTGGLYQKVKIQDRIEKFQGFKPWIALLYTEPVVRGQGYGALLLGEIERQAREIGQEKIYLFTHSAQSLYERNGWSVMEMVESAGKKIAVMEKNL